MVWYELKKVFSRTGSRIALLLLLVLTGVTCYFAMDVYYMNEEGEKEYGPEAVDRLRAVQKEWSGYLDEEKLRQAIAENIRIRTTPEALSPDYRENNIAYGRGQGIDGIRSLLNCAYAQGFQEFDYYRADALSEADAVDFYENRPALLKEWLEKDAKDQFSDREKAWLLRQYEEIQTPFYYDYMKGWIQLFEFSPTILMITMLILGYLVSGIFAGEFTWKADAVFFASLHGRKKATMAKLRAGFCIVTAVYWIMVLVYSSVVLCYLGADGWNCPVQADWTGWKCLYPVTVGQKYLLILAGGYIGCLFLSFLCMLVSAKTKSAVLAVMAPFVLIFLPSFLGNIDSSAVNKILGLLPDQLLQAGTALNYFHVYSFGGKVSGAVPILLTAYTILTGMAVPLIYREYAHKQAG